MIFLFITIILSTLYGALMLLYRIGWTRQKRQRNPANNFGGKNFSIIIPARDEEDNIGALLQSIFAQDYPAQNFEVIVVDDHSGDRTAEVVNSLARQGLRLVRLSDHLPPSINSAKKHALALGIAQSNFEIIVTTDADCIVPEGWLRSLAAAYEQPPGPVLVAAPVDFIKARGLLYYFQSLDFMAMQGITAAAAALRLGTMTNGANLSFSREAFATVSGYAGIDHLASGDDYLLAHKMVNHFGAARFRYQLAAEAVVKTAAQKTWALFLQQRIRWASKNGKYGDHRLTAILALVYIYNVWLLALAALQFFVSGIPAIFFAALFCKIVVEVIFLLPVARFFRKRGEMFLFPFLQPLHILYVVVAGLLGAAGSYRWKGRQVR